MIDSASSVLLKINEALLIARDERDILACVALCADLNATLRLIYLERNADSTLIDQSRVVASWKDGAIWDNDPTLATTLSIQDEPWLAQMASEVEQSPELVWLVEDLNSYKAIPIKFLTQDIRGLALIKLYGPSGGMDFVWHSALCFTWSTPHSFTEQEKHIFTAVSQSVSAVVGNRRLHLQALEHIKLLRELDQLKTDFLYSISHELRTPLGGIITVADSMLHGTSGELSDDVRADVEVIHQSGTHLLQVINDILEFAKIEAGGITLYYEKFDLAHVINEAIRKVKWQADEKAISIETHIAEGLPRISADRTRICQVLVNLVGNAIKFTERGAVRIYATCDDQTVTVCVEDDGIGISPQYHEVIFERFRQIESPLRRKTGGTGLGLPISKHFVELHGGHIWVISELNQGAKFYFTLPLGHH